MVNVKSWGCNGYGTTGLSSASWASAPSASRGILRDVPVCVGRSLCILCDAHCGFVSAAAARASVAARALAARGTPPRLCRAPASALPVSPGLSALHSLLGPPLGLHSTPPALTPPPAGRRRPRALGAWNTGLIARYAAADPVVRPLLLLLGERRRACARRAHSFAVSHFSDAPGVGTFGTNGRIARG